MKTATARAATAAATDSRPGGRPRLKPLDLTIALVAAAAVAVSAIVAYGPAASRAEAVIRGRGGDWVYPLDAERKIAVEGPLGETIVLIEGGTVRVVDSPCLNKTCIAAGAISRPGQWVACLPNQVFVSVEGRGDGGVDASVY